MYRVFIVAPVAGGLGPPVDLGSEQEGQSTQRHVFPCRWHNQNTDKILLFEYCFGVFTNFVFRNATPKRTKIVSQSSQLGKGILANVECF